MVRRVDSTYDWLDGAHVPPGGAVGEWPAGPAAAEPGPRAVGGALSCVLPRRHDAYGYRRARGGVPGHRAAGADRGAGGAQRAGHVELVELRPESDALLSAPAPPRPAAAEAEEAREAPGDALDAAVRAAERDADAELAEEGADAWSRAVASWVGHVLQTRGPEVEAAALECERLWWRVRAPRPRWYTWPTHVLAVLAEMADPAGFRHRTPAGVAELIAPDAFVARHWPRPLGARFSAARGAFHFQRHVFDKVVVHLRTALVLPP